MAVSVKGTFEVLDKASRPIRSIRDAAKEADIQVKKLGHDLDQLGVQQQIARFGAVRQQIKSIGEESSRAEGEADELGRRLDHVGAPQLARNLDTTNRSIANTSTAAAKARGDTEGFSNEMERLGKRSERTGSWLDNLGKRLVGLRPPMMALLVPMVGLAAQGLGGLLAGTVALIPKLTDLAGLAGPAGVAFTGMGVAMLTVKLATNDLSKAMSGNKKALADLTPEARNFVQTLKLYEPVLAGIRQSAQRGLFPGLSTSIREMAGAAPVIKQIVGGMGSTLGGLAAQAGGMFSSSSFLRDFQLIASNGQATIGRLGSSFLNLLTVVRNFLVAAGPFTTWLGQSIKHFSEWAAVTSTTARETGVLAAHFDRTRRALSTIGDVLKNVLSIFKSVGGAGREMGDSLWGGIDRATKRWADFLRGPQGQQDMQSYFVKMKPLLHETGKFIGDLVGSLGKLSQGSGFTAAIRSLDEALPSLTKGLGSLAETFGPTIIKGLSEFLQIASQLASTTGPLGGTLRLIGGILTTINSLIKHVPLLGTVLSTALTLVAFNGFMAKLGFMDSKIGKLMSSWLGVKAAADSATAAEGRAAAVGGVGAVGVGGVARSTPAVVGGAGAAAEEAGGLSSLANSRAGLGLTATVGGLAAIKALPGLAKGALAAAGRFLLPITLLSGALGAAGTSGGLSERLAGGLSGATFGLSKLLGGPFAPTSVGVGEAQEHAGAALRTNIATGQRQHVDFGSGVGGTTFAEAKLPGYNSITGAFTGQGVNDRIAANQLATARVRVRGNEETLRHPGNLSAQGVGAVRSEMEVWKEVERNYKGFQERQKMAAETNGRQMAEGLGQAYNEYARHFGPDHAFSLTTKNILTDMSHLKGAGRTAMGQSVVEWARQLEQSEPKLRKPIDAFLRHFQGGWNDLGDHVRIVNGMILTGSATQWHEIGKAMEGPMGHAEYVVKGTLSNIFREAVGALETMGFSGGTAKNLIQGVARGQLKYSEIGKGEFSQSYIQSRHNQAASMHGKAGGGRIAGAGLQDTVPLTLGMAAPGELVVNRHTERRVNNKLAAFGTSLGGEVAMETMPHSAPMFQRGGRSRAEHGSGALVASASSGALGNVLAGVREVATAMLQQFPGLAVTSTRSGTHASHSLHYLGEAVDLAGTSPLMNRAAAWVGKAYGRELEEGIHNPNLSIKHGANVAPSFWGEPTWGQHANHIHIGVLGGGGAAGASAGGGNVLLGSQAGHVSLKRQPFGGGLPGVLVAGVHNAIAAGLERRINEKLGAGAGGAALGGHGGGGTHAQNEALGHQMMLQAGFPESEWPYLQKLWTQESGWDANSVNKSSGAYGIPQALGHGHPFALGDVRAQIAWGLNYIRGRPDERTPRGAWAHEVAHNWYTMGGRAPAWGGWNQAGGVGRFDRPTLLGLGEGHRRETVKITPEENRAGNSSAGGGKGKVAINFTPGSIVIHGTDHAAAKKFVDHVLGEVAAALEDMGMESEQGVSL